ncbi:hypothetical protein ACFLU4_02145 [Chloroflexota bacterium]
MKRDSKRLITIWAIPITLFIILVVAIPVTVYAAAALLQPSFETVSSWTYTEEDAQYNGAQSSAWASQGSNSYLLSATNGTISALDHAQIAQTVDMSRIDTLSFDVRGYNSKAAEDVVHTNVYVGGVETWTQALPESLTTYLHNEVDLSAYTGASTSLAFALEAHVQANAADLGAYFDNVKLWGSYISDRTTVTNTFGTSGNSVYMYGENFDSTGTYKVAYYNGGTSHDGTDGAKLETDEFTDDADGILDQSLITPLSYPSASYGTWHAVVYKTTGTMPASYDLVSTGDSAYAVTDSFTVQASAIPEFPTIVAAISVTIMCFGTYYWLRKRRLGHAKVQSHVCR